MFKRFCSGSSLVCGIQKDKFWVCTLQTFVIFCGTLEASYRSGVHVHYYCMPSTHHLTSSSFLWLLMMAMMSQKFENSDVPRNSKNTETSVSIHITECITD